MCIYVCCIGNKHAIMIKLIDTILNMQFYVFGEGGFLLGCVGILRS